MSVSPDVAIMLDHFGSGGVERVACHLANGLQRRGFKVEMVVLDDSGPVRSLLDDSVGVFRLGTAQSTHRHSRMMAAIPALATYLRNRRPRIFHSPGNHTNLPAAVAAAMAGFKGALVPKITNRLVDDKMSWHRRLLRRTTYRMVLAKASLVLAISRASIGEIAAIHPPAKRRARFVHNAYVDERMIEAAAMRNPSEPPVILSLGRLSEQKNHAMLLRAAARLGEREWRLRICGMGPQEAALRDLAEQLGIASRIEFPGFVADPVPEYLSASVVALSSRWEGVPATVVEAIACGCPLVCTASSAGLVDLLQEVGAAKPLAVDDEAGFAQALEAALEGRLPRIPALAARPYGIEAACDEHAALFSQLIAKASETAPAGIRRSAGPSG